MATSPPRLYVEAPLRSGEDIALSMEQAHYLRHVLRLSDEAAVKVFNDRDGEWLARLKLTDKKSASLKAEKELRSQPPADDIWYIFAPLKQARLDYMAQKATEMGASRLIPVVTQNTQVGRINGARLRANAIEAAEQCGLLSVPEVKELQPLGSLLAVWPKERHMIFCDEAASVTSPMNKMRAIADAPCAVLVGPEGGFSEKERETLLNKPFAIPISLGSRVLRADTAAIAALALLWAARADSN